MPAEACKAGAVQHPPVQRPEAMLGYAAHPIIAQAASKAVEEHMPPEENGHSPSSSTQAVRWKCVYLGLESGGWLLSPATLQAEALSLGRTTVHVLQNVACGS